jgi:hypothetical protein
MKKILIIILCTCLFACTSRYSHNDTSSTNIRTEGSLESKNNLGCIPTAQLSNHYTPADMYRASAQCLREENFFQAIVLFYTAGAYGVYDGMRVSDPSAGQARQALILMHVTPVLQQMPDDKKATWKSGVQQVQDANSQLSQEICTNLLRLGPPDYYPRYMINHGLIAITNALQRKAVDEQAQLVPNFDSQKAWNRTIHSLHCS